MLKNAIWLFAFTLIMFLSFLPSYRKMQDLKQKNKDYAQRIIDLQKKNVNLEREMQRLETDPAYLEKVGREKMGLIRDGETVYRVVPAKKIQKPR